MSEEGRAGVICAMDSEAAQLRQRLRDPRELPVGAWRRTRGTLGPREVDLVVSGIGLVNAAAATATLALTSPPRALLNYGAAGAHREDIACGDVVLARDLVHPTSQIVRPDGERRYKGFGYDVDGRRVEAEAIPADPDLLAGAERLAVSLALPPWPGTDRAPQVHVGTVASADVWTQHAGEIRALHRRHGSLCEEMEAAAVAQVAAIFGIPFLAVKDIANNELVSVTDLDASGAFTLAHLGDEVARRAALVIEALIRVL